MDINPTELEDATLKQSSRVIVVADSFTILALQNHAIQQTAKLSLRFASRLPESRSNNIYENAPKGS